jgi:hypothetical protein
MKADLSRAIDEATQASKAFEAAIETIQQAQARVAAVTKGTDDELVKQVKSDWGAAHAQLVEAGEAITAGTSAGREFLNQI